MIAGGHARGMLRVVGPWPNRPNPMPTPAHTAPERYLSPTHAIPRSAPNKPGGAAATGPVPLRSTAPPGCHRPSVRSPTPRPIYRLFPRSPPADRPPPGRTGPQPAEHPAMETLGQFAPVGLSPHPAITPPAGDSEAEFVEAGRRGHQPIGFRCLLSLSLCSRYRVGGRRGAPGAGGGHAARRAWLLPFGPDELASENAVLGFTPPFRDGLPALLSMASTDPGAVSRTPRRSTLWPTRSQGPITPCSRNPIESGYRQDP